MNRVRFRKAGMSGSEEIVNYFIVTDFDLSNQSNASFHVIGDSYKVASYGDRVSLKVISGVLINPEVNLPLLVDGFYREAYIGNNYGSPINVSYLNYYGYGHLVGMEVALSEGRPATVTLQYLELESEKDAFQQPKDSISEELREQLDNKRDYLDMGLTLGGRYGILANTAVLNQETMEPEISSTPIPVSAMTLAWSSRYSVVDSRKNIVYFGENPVQISCLHTIVETGGDYGLALSSLKKLLEIKPENRGEVFLEAGGITMVATVVAISAPNRSVQANNMAINISMVAESSL